VAAAAKIALTLYVVAGVVVVVVVVVVSATIDLIAI
jgi:hypothetical protein